jgi:4-alpha-glucanotransferase
MARRVSGLLLHLTSLPGGHGIGDLGREAYRFVDLLAEAGQSLWQVLPLGPPGVTGSPYDARSAFAGNPLLISLDRLAEEGLLAPEDLLDTPLDGDGPVDFAAVERLKTDRLRRAFARFDPRAHRGFDLFRRRAVSWLGDFTLFMALRERHGSPWTGWPRPLARHDETAVARARGELAREIRFHAFVQWAFHEQWQALRRYAHGRGIQILGDMPIFVTHDSADVWAHQGIFRLDGAGQPTVVAGVPPDYFSSTGQRWGNPLYRWEAIVRRGFDWWIERFRWTLAMVDLVRVDHFRGFEACWEVPAAAETAERGRWVASPGEKLFAAVRAALGAVPVVAEDLGLITPEVEALRDSLDIPGMKVLQFAFGGEADNPYLPHTFQPRCVVYTGTHDNDTTRGWYDGAGPAVQDHVRRYLGVDGHDIVWDMIRLAQASVAETAVVPVQDVLGLDSTARMNTPALPDGNWTWRLAPFALAPHHVERLRDLTALYGRLPAPGPARLAVRGPDPRPHSPDA